MTATPCPALSPAAAYQKPFKTLQARAALAGFVLTTVEDSRGHFYMATRWDCSHTFDRVHKVEAWLDKGATAAGAV